MNQQEFKEVRKSLGLTQVGLAHKLMLTQSHVCAIEKGRKPVTEEVYIKMMDLAERVPKKRMIETYIPKARPKIKVDFDKPYAIDKRVVSWK